MDMGSSDGKQTATSHHGDGPDASAEPERSGGQAGHNGESSHDGESGQHGESGHDGTSGHGGAAEAVSTVAKWTLSADEPQPNEETTVTIRVETAAGDKVESFDINHEKKMHLIAVSEDLSYFDHLHPEYEGSGEFKVRTKFPRAGRYKLIADYIPSGGSATTNTEWIEVAGASAEKQAIEPDEKLDRTADGYRVELTVDPLKANKEAMLTFKLSDASSGEPIDDLEPYLGAVGHVVILSADTEKYLHVHPMDEDAKGPVAEFMTEFPESGVYKIWGQFQRNGKTFVVPFTVKVS